MLAKKKTPRAITNIFIYFYVFFIIYAPRFSDLLFGIQSEYINLVFLIIMCVPFSIYVVNEKKISRINRQTLILWTGVIFGVLYTFIIAILNGHEVRLFQGLYLLGQCVHLYLINHFMNITNFTLEDKLLCLYRLALIQFFIAISMLIFPSFKSLALELYYLGREENIFISAMRIYGISGDYTFFTPIYHGILAGVSVIFYIFSDNKFILYLFPLLLLILLNGRYGFIVFSVVFLVIFFYYIKRMVFSKKVLNAMLFMILSLVLITSIAYFLSPSTYRWLVSGVIQIISIIQKEPTRGTVDTLLYEMIFLPEGWKLVFGCGHRVIGNMGLNTIGIASDIGYINDLYIGGVVFVIIQYFSVISFVLKSKVRYSCFGNNEKQKRSMIMNFLVIALLVANFKGEVMRGGTAILSVIMLTLFLNNSRDNIKYSYNNDVGEK